MRNLLRKAGQGLSNLDTQYANALINDRIPDPMDRGHTMAISEAMKSGYEGNAVLSGLIKGGLVTSNVAARYALPLGGMTLAGKGLMDLTGMFVGENEQTSSTIMPS